MNAFLLNCAPSEVETEKANFKFTEIVPGTQPTIGEAGKYGTVQRYFYEVLLCQTANWHPLYSVDVTRTMAKKQEMLSKYACQNAGNELVKEKTSQAALRGSQRVPKCAYAETLTASRSRRAFSSSSRKPHL